LRKKILESRPRVKPFFPNPSFFSKKIGNAARNAIREIGEIRGFFKKNNPENFQPQMSRITADASPAGTHLRTLKPLTCIKLYASISDMGKLRKLLSRLENPDADNACKR